MSTPTLRDPLGSDTITGLREAAEQLLATAQTEDDRTAARFGLQLVGELERQQRIAGLWKDLAAVAFKRLGTDQQDAMLGEFKRAFLSVDSERGAEAAKLFGVWLERERLPAPRRPWWRRLLGLGAR